METYIIRLFEGSYLYSEKEVLGPLPSHLLFAGVLEELNHQYNYRPTEEALWAKIIQEESGEELYRVSRKSSGKVTVREVSNFDKPFEFVPLESYSFVGVIDFTKTGVGK